MQDESTISTDQLNPGEKDKFGKEALIKKDEGISDQGNEWADEEGITQDRKNLLGKKAEKYIRDSGDIEDLPEESDLKE